MIDKNLACTSTLRPNAESAALTGTWECLFPFESLTWSDGIYDLFELPRGMRITRSEALGFYTDESRAELETIRAGAIEKRTSFTLDLEITTALGKSRWVRMVSHVEYSDDIPHRVYGTMEEITAEKAQL